MQIPSEQSFAAYDPSRKLVAGNLEKDNKVHDTWVFQRALKKDLTTRQGIIAICEWPQQGVVLQTPDNILHVMLAAISALSSGQL